MEKNKKRSWMSKLNFSKWRVSNAYSDIADIYEDIARRSQIQEDRFVYSEIERLAQEQYIDRITNDPEYYIYIRYYERCYHVYDYMTAKFRKDRLNINQLIQDRYNELLSNHF